MKFSNKLSFVILATGLIVLTISSFTLYNFSHNSIVKSQLMVTKSIADEVSGDIDLLLFEKVKTALTLANTPIIKKALETSNLSYSDLSAEKRKESIKRLNEKWIATKDPADNFILKFTDNKVSDFLKNQQRILKGEYGEIFLTNKFGALVASTAKLSTLAHGHKYWWLGSYNNGEGAIFFDDRGYDDSVGGYVLGLVVPIRKGMEIIGVLKCNLNILGSISELMFDEKNQLLGKLKLVRSGGMVVFEKGFEPLSTQVHGSIFEKLKNKKSGSFIINDSGEKVIVGCSEIELTKGGEGYGFGGTFESIDHKKGNTGESWYVVYSRQMSAALMPFTQSIKTIILIGIAIILILVLVSYLFGRKIAKPLAVLNKATEKIGKGDFEYRIDERRKDEFGALARSFNSMAGKLQETTTSIVELEHEITERKQAEEELRESEEKYRSLFTSTNDGACVHELIYKNDKPLDYRISDVNPRYESIIGVKRDDVIGVLGSELYGSGEAPYLNIYADVVKTGRSKSFETYFAPMGKYFLISVFSTGAHKFATVFQDITDSKRAKKDKRRLEDKLHRAQKMESLGLMAGGIAHDLNNILSGLVSYPELLLLDIPVDSPMRKPMETIKKSGMRAVDVVSDLITIARGVATVKEVLNLNTIVTEYLGSAEHQKLERTHSFIDFKAELNPDLLNLNGSSTHINKTLMNLVVNASEAIEGTGTVTISTTNRYLDEPLKGYEDVRIGEYAVLSVSDDGSGISSEDLEKIFEPFYTKKVMGRSGTGLGLAVVWNSVQDHNGYIDVKSSEEGTVFELYFRLTRDQIAEDTEDVPAAEYQGHGEKILVVDDEENQREIACGMLTKLGYIAEAVSSGEEAIEYVKKNPVDLIVLDMVMPKGINGRKTYEEIIKIRPGQKAIIASGHAKTKEVDLAQELGAGKYIRVYASYYVINCT